MSTDKVRSQGHTSRNTVALGLALLLAIGVTVASVWLLFNPQWLRRFQAWGYIGAFIINAVASATLVLPLPGAALVIAMGTQLNPWWLSIVSGLGSALGEFTGYFAGATGQALIPESQRPLMDKIHAQTEKYGALLLIALAAYPFPLFDLAGIAAGASKMKIWKFFLATAIGKSIKYAFLIILGAAPLEVILKWLMAR